MLIGIDVGGTFTDAVVIQDGHILASGKERTTKEQLMYGILAALDRVMHVVIPDQVERVTLSTTVVTNTIVSRKEAPVDLYVVTGPGMNVDHSFPVAPIYVNGYTDHRGIVVEPSAVNSLAELKPKSVGTKSVQTANANSGQTEHTNSEESQPALAAISAKFSVRNPEQEQKLADGLRDLGYETVSRGGALSGSLNFPRRTISAYFNSAVTPVFSNFKSSVEQALAARHITAPLYILKADGGSLPIEVMADRHVETVFTGPAASVLGLYALDQVKAHHTVALDIGGTTTDISLWKEGKPLMTKGGVMIREYPSAVRSFAVQSVGIGGESVVTVDEAGLHVGPERRGPSVALGGSEPTLGDALITKGYAHYGDEVLAREAMIAVGKLLAAQTSESASSDQLNESGLPVQINGALLSADEVSDLIIQNAVSQVQQAIQEVVTLENKRPIYVVEDIVNPDEFKPQALVVVGGTAQSLGPIIGKTMDFAVEIPESAAVANAIGAAVALNTIEITLHVDTKRRLLVIPELGINEKNATIHHGQETVDLAFQYVKREAQRLGLSDVQEPELISVEDFPVVEGWHSMERLITVKVQLKAGVSTYVS